jgi:two-component system CheB/CheR fusion protein
MTKSKSKPGKQEEASNTDMPTGRERGEHFLIVGMGASAGGIQAFTEFFHHTPAKSGIAYVVILHLSPDHDSKLAEVLQTATKMPVQQVNEKIKLQPDHVYVVPPNKHLTMEDGHILVSPNTQIEERRAPVDIFFRTLADVHGSDAIAVILSGTGANGSMGLKRVKEKGGATFVQNPREAEFNEMPRNSIATGLVDEVLNVADIPARIISYKNSLGKVQISEEAEKRPVDQQQALREIFTNIKIRTGHDFSNYKRPTLLRRIERRINIHGMPDLPSYVAYMNQDPKETNALLKDLLISVTNFFRDKKAYAVIENEILPVLLQYKNNENQLRIWVAGCATGEEAYSLAILCAEKTAGIIDAPKINIFATDIDEAAISQAREGLYSINDLADVSPERLRRFFIKEGEEYRIRREVRETIMFANHNFLKDPPFSHLDLISCRNVMIYLNQIAQERVAETFHFALKPGGFLFLGSSESVDAANDLYASYNRENHIFQSRQATARAYPIPESVPSFRIDRPALTQTEQQNKVPERISFSDLHQQLLEQYAPPSLVVNEEYDIVHLSERAGRYLQISGGEPSQNLMKLVKPELRLELRSALFQAVQRQSAVEAKGLKVNIDEHTETLNLHVRPVLRAGDTARGFFLVIFETASEREEKEILITSDESVARHLEDELMRLKAQLRSSIEQHEFQQEELKASNEELQAMNEELRSAAEELETSKEELQSINEELRTVNQELKVKIEETSITSNNLQNLINSTDIGTIFLDRNLRVGLFTPATRYIFNLIPADYGRPLADITHKLEYDNVLQDAETVLEKLTAFETEVRTIEGKAFLMRITPYRTTEDRINGVVITFVNITDLKESERQLKENMGELTRFHDLMVSRESRMIELKKEINALCIRLGETPMYPLEFENGDNHESNQNQ